VSLDTLLEQVATSASYALVESYGGDRTTCRWRTFATARPGSRSATTAKSWRWSMVARRGCWCPPVSVEERQVGARDPAGDQDEPGFWESLGYHHYGDPWQEQRFWGD
jgi:hypothetical protein